jgi:hypothetical protein
VVDVLGRRGEGEEKKRQEIERQAKKRNSKDWGSCEHKIPDQKADLN